MISSGSQGGPNIALITIACGWTFVGFAILGVILLIWSRRIKKVNFGLDVYLTILALVTTIALIGQTTWAIVCEGQDAHEAEVSRTKFPLVVRSLLINETLWGVVNTLLRLSAILFIKRLFVSASGIRKPGIWKVWLLLVLTVLYGLVVFLEIFLICHPMAVDWNAHIDGTCGDQVISYLVLEVFGLFLDLAILAVPIQVIWTLQMKFASKMSVTILFSSGFLIFIITGLRIQALRLVDAEDFTYAKGYLGLLSALGASLRIIICCAPVVPVIYHHCRSMLVEYVSHINEMTSVFRPTHTEVWDLGTCERYRSGNLSLNWRDFAIAIRHGIASDICSSVEMKRKNEGVEDQMQVQ